MLLILICLNWIIFLYNLIICELKKKFNFKRRKMEREKNRFVLFFFFLGVCFSCCFNVDIVWLLLGFFLRIFGLVWLKLDCFIDYI